MLISLYNWTERMGDRGADRLPHLRVLWPAQSEERFNKKMEQLMEKQMEEMKMVMKNTAQASAREAKTAEVQLRSRPELARTASCQSGRCLGG